MVYDLVVIGSGAAGLSAALYGGRYRMKVVVIAKEFGGETAKAGNIENYPGVPGVDGYDLMETIKAQAQGVGATFVSGEVVRISRDEHHFSIATKDAEYKTHAVILATGAERRRLNLPNEKELTGRGVHYCITCDGPVYSGKTIAVVGGGDASVKGVILAAEYAEKIYLLVRGKEVTAEPINFEKLKSLGEKLEVILETEVKEVVGTQRLERVGLSKPYHESEDLVVDGLFVEIGAMPNVGLVEPLGVLLDERGYVKVDALMQTNVDGVFACGDAVNHFGAFKQDITAAATGAVAATSAYNDKKVHGDTCPYHAVPSMQHSVAS